MGVEGTLSKWFCRHECLLFKQKDLGSSQQLSHKITDMAEYASIPPALERGRQMLTISQLATILTELVRFKFSETRSLKEASGKQ